MRHRHAWIAGAALFVCAAAGAQQAPWDSPEAEGDRIAPITSYPLGRADLVASGMVNMLRLNRIKEDLCARYGCLIVVNESRAYKLMEMRIAMPSRDGSTRWGANQLVRPLQSMKATLRVKVPDLKDCSLPVRFVLREAKGKEEVTLEDRVRLCAEPDQHTLMRIRAAKARVEVLE